MHKLLIHCPTLIEAKTFINFLKLKQNNNLKNLPTNTSIFQDENSETILVVSGIGKEKTLESLNFVYENFTITKAVHIGLASCSDSSIKIGTLFCTNKLLNNINFGSITTVDIPLQTDEDLETLLVDSSANYFLDVTKDKSKDFFVFKIVSDYFELTKLDENFITSLIEDVYPKINRYF